MKLAEARQYVLAEAVKPETRTTGFYIMRVKPRDFEVLPFMPLGGDLVQIIHTEWVRSGWYRRYHPEWFAAEEAEPLQEPGDDAR